MKGVKLNKKKLIKSWGIGVTLVVGNEVQVEQVGIFLGKSLVGKFLEKCIRICTMDLASNYTSLTIVTEMEKIEKK